MATNIELCETFLCSYASRLSAARNTNGCDTDYGLYSSNIKKNKYYFMIFIILNEI